MLTCTPEGLCSWNYQITGGDHRARLEFRWLNEEGGITVDGASLSVVKHGMFSGTWTLEGPGDPKILMTARKPSALSRVFEIETPRSPALALHAKNPLTRIFVLEEEGRDLALFEPEHALTRRARIEAEPGTDFPTLAFCFWLVALCWRRAANNNNGGA